MDETSNTTNVALRLGLGLAHRDLIAAKRAVDSGLREVEKALEASRGPQEAPPPRTYPTLTPEAKKAFVEVLTALAKTGGDRGPGDTYSPEDNKAIYEAYMTANVSEEDCDAPEVASALVFTLRAIDDAAVEYHGAWFRRD